MLDDFSRVLRFKPHLRVFDAGPDVLFVIDEFRRSVLRGAIYVQVAACMREGMTIAQTLAALAENVSEWEVLAALDHLVRQSYVRADVPGKRDHELGFFERAGLDGDAACEQVARLQVAVRAFGVDAAPQLAAFAASGITVSPDAAFTIALVDTYARQELAALANQVAARGEALLVVIPIGVQALIGPLLVGGDADHEVPCFTCVQYWTSLNRPVQTLLSRHHGDAAMQPGLAYTRASQAAVCAFVAALVEQLAVSDNRRAQARREILALRLDTLTTASHRVVRRPQCPCCGNPRWMREMMERAPVLAEGKLFAANSGGFRATSPQQVFQRYAHHVSPVSGAVAYLHPMPGRHEGLRNVYVAGYLACPPAVPRTNRFDLICAGKGRSGEQARVSALCEAIERFSGVYQGDEASLRASMSELRQTGAKEGGGTPIHLNDLQQYSERQFECRDAINALTDDVRKQVPVRFSADDVIDWTPAWSLNTGARHWVPLSYCFAGTPETAGDLQFCVHNPNGSAAGSCLEEAILQGLFELIERDATAIWWYNQVLRPGIDLKSFRDPYIDALEREYDAMGWRLWALDLTHDLAIPVVVAIAENRATGCFSIGFGCHLLHRIALERALTEVNQLLDVAADAPPPWDNDKLSSKQFLYPSVEARVVVAQSSSADAIAVRSDLKGAIEECMKRLTQAGMETLVVDKTRPDLGLAVVQVIVPGLCHFWPRFGASRLRNVPVELGWLDKAREESELNGALLFL